MYWNNNKNKDKYKYQSYSISNGYLKLFDVNIILYKIKYS